MSNSKKSVQVKNPLFVFPRPPITKVETETVLTVLEPATELKKKIGQKDQWLYIRTPDGAKGYVSAQHLQIHIPDSVSFGIGAKPAETKEIEAKPTKEAIPVAPVSFGISAVKVEIEVKVASPEVGYLNMRSQPSTSGTLITKVSHGNTVTPLEPEGTVRAKVGQRGEWLHVRLDDGREVYAAAWYLELSEKPAEPPETPSVTVVEEPGPEPPKPVTKTKASEFKVWIYSPEVGYLNIRNAPSTSGALVTKAQHDTSLVPLEPEADIRGKVGQRGEWLKVRLDDGQEGYGAASYFSLISTRAPDAELEPPTEQKIAITSNLNSTERQVANAWNRLGGLLQVLADKLAIDPGVAVAVLTVESGGRSFGTDGRMIIRFENQIFYDRWGKNNPNKFGQHFVYNSDKRWTGHQWRSAPDQAWRSFHGDQNNEWEVLEFACTLDDTAAKSSISMGGPQIMGFNYAGLGYTSVQKMFDAFVESERNQATGFFNFVRSRGAKTIQMLQNSNFEGFAKIYNGSGQATHYGNLIRKTYDAYKRLSKA